MRAGLAFVLAGSCAFQFEDRFEINAGEFIELPQGGFEFEAFDEGVELVQVWEIVWD